MKKEDREGAKETGQARESRYTCVVAVLEVWSFKVYLKSFCRTHTVHVLTNAVCVVVEVNRTNPVRPAVLRG